MKPVKLTYKSDTSYDAGIKPFNEERFVGRHSTAVAFALRNPAAPGSILGSRDIFGKKLRLDDSCNA